MITNMVSVTYFDNHFAGCLRISSMLGDLGLAWDTNKFGVTLFAIILLASLVFIILFNEAHRVSLCSMPAPLSAAAECTPNGRHHIR